MNIKQGKALRQDPPPSNLFSLLFWPQLKITPHPYGADIGFQIKKPRNTRKINSTFSIISEIPSNTSQGNIYLKGYSPTCVQFSTQPGSGEKVTSFRDTLVSVQVIVSNTRQLYFLPKSLIQIPVILPHNYEILKLKSSKKENLARYKLFKLELDQITQNLTQLKTVQPQDLIDTSELRSFYVKLNYMLTELFFLEKQLSSRWLQKEFNSIFQKLTKNELLFLLIYVKSKTESQIWWASWFLSFLKTQQFKSNWCLF